MKRNKAERSTTRSKSARYADLKQMLEERRREIVSEVQGKIRDVRTEGTTQKLNEVFDAGESSEADIQEDIEFALIQMKSETLTEDQRRAVAGSRRATTATASSAARRSPRARLRALPFAVRCKDCEEAREVAQQRERLMSQRRPVVAVLRHVQLVSPRPQAPPVGGACAPHRPPLRTARSTKRRIAR